MTKKTRIGKIAKIAALGASLLGSAGCYSRVSLNGEYRSPIHAKEGEEFDKRYAAGLGIELGSEYKGLAVTGKASVGNSRRHQQFGNNAGTIEIDPEFSAELNVRKYAWVPTKIIKPATAEEIAEAAPVYEDSAEIDKLEEMHGAYLVRKTEVQKELNTMKKRGEIGSDSYNTLNQTMKGLDAYGENIEKNILKLRAKDFNSRLLDKLNDSKNEMNDLIKKMNSLEEKTEAPVKKAEPEAEPEPMPEPEDDPEPEPEEPLMDAGNYHLFGAQNISYDHGNGKYMFAIDEEETAPIESEAEEAAEVTEEAVGEEAVEAAPAAEEDSEDEEYEDRRWNLFIEAGPRVRKQEGSIHIPALGIYDEVESGTTFGYGANLGVTVGSKQRRVGLEAFIGVDYFHKSAEDFVGKAGLNLIISK